MTGELAQPGQPGEGTDPFLTGLLLIVACTAQLGQCSDPGLFIEFAFGTAQFGLQRDFSSRRQFFQHLVFGAAQNEGPNQPRQRFAPIGILVPFDWVGKTIAETVPRTEQTGADGAKQAPQFAEMVFQRRSGESYPPIRVNSPDCLGSLRLRVLDELRFVEHQGVPRA